MLIRPPIPNYPHLRWHTGSWESPIKWQLLRLRITRKPAVSHYYLLIAGKEEGPYSADQIRDGIEDESISQDQSARTGPAEDWVPLDSLVKFEQANGKISPASDLTKRTFLSNIVEQPPPSSPSAPKPAPDRTAYTPPGDPVKAYLFILRRNSSYFGIRLLINIVLVLSCLINLGLITAAIIGHWPWEKLIVVIACASSAFLFAIALKLATNLLIDIADTLIREHSKDHFE